MKPDANQLFGNLFDDVHITDARLLNFGNDLLGNLKAANSSNQYNDLITMLNKVLPPLQTQVSEVDTALTQQLGKTLTNNQVMTLFKKTMSNKEGFIAEVLDGRGTPAYLEFYPKGISEYNGATKTTMATLTSRVNDAATKYTAQLGATITALLTGFESNWQTSREDQREQIGTVTDTRTGRTAARTNAEICLIQVVHGIAGILAPNVAACTALCTFSLLFTQIKHKHMKVTGGLTPGQTATVLNHTLKDDNTVTAHNTGTNAAWCIWLGATTDAALPGNPITMQPGENKNIKPSDLGDLKNTFLLLKA